MLKNKSIGIVGGGQLAQMFIEECNRFGVRINVLDKSDCPANTIASTFIEGDVNNPNDIRTLSKLSDILTFELENINVDVLIDLEKEGKEIIPRPHVLQIIQDKVLQKKFFDQNNIANAKWEVANSVEDIPNALSKLGSPNTYVLKFDKGGYDGKGVCVVRNNLIPDFVRSHKGKFVIEVYHENLREISVIAFVDKYGNIGFYQPIEMIFNSELNLIDYLITPIYLDERTFITICELTKKVVSNLNSAGLFAIEMFLTESGVLINEISPRPHNSGHPTIESCKTSQYEQLIRILMGWPCGSTEISGAAGMINIIGPKDIHGDYVIDYQNLLEIDDVHLHIYGKSQSSPGRKMGHITITSEDIKSLQEKIGLVKSKTFIKKPNFT